jgi:hypothetical protein
LEPVPLHQVAYIFLRDTINNYFLAGYELQLSKVPRGAYNWEPVSEPLVKNHEHSCIQDSNIQETSVVPDTTVITDVDIPDYEEDIYTLVEGPIYTDWEDSYRQGGNDEYGTGRA